MQLCHLHINNFKNIEETDLYFSPKVNCLIGNNGMGKSNLLDAIYYLSFCRSFTGIPDNGVTRRAADFMMLHGDYRRRDTDETVTAGLAKGRRKSFKRRGKEYERLSLHIGAFPLVLISPSDHNLITGTGEDRRRFMDMIISQSDAVYLDSLIRYNHALEQRNRLLRTHDPAISDPDLMAAIEMPMVEAATYLHDARRTWVDEFNVIFGRHYAAVAGDGEVPGLAYESRMDANTGMADILSRNRERDIILGYTSSGPHRDDIEMSINYMPVKRVASQGQCKTYTVSMRLAQYEFLRDKSGLKPLLLLDDIFDKLDARRVERIIDMVRDDMFGQIFITDTNRDHLGSIMPRTHVDYHLWTVDNGTFTLVPNRLPL